MSRSRPYAGLPQETLRRWDSGGGGVKPARPPTTQTQTAFMRGFSSLVEAGTYLMRVSVVPVRVPSLSRADSIVMECCRDKEGVTQVPCY